MNLLKTLIVKLAQMDLKESEGIKELLDYSGEAYKDIFQQPSESDPEKDFFQFSRKEIENMDVVKEPVDTAGIRPRNLIGRGAYRVVCNIGGNKVLKVSIFGVTGSKMNREEFLLQQDFKGMFPKVYMHGKGKFDTDFDWIIVEKVDVIYSYEEFNSYFPHLGKATEEMFREGFGRAYPGIKKEVFEYLIKEAEKDVLFGKLLKLKEKTKLELFDIKPGNIGKDKDGNFLIIDASIFNF